MMNPSIGIGGKLNIGVGIVVLVSTLAFGAFEGLIERSAILREKQSQLAHLAALAALTFDGVEDPALSSRVSDFSRQLTKATGSSHQIWIENASGQLIICCAGAVVDSSENPTQSTLWEKLLPSTLREESLISDPTQAAPNRLIVEESLVDLPKEIGRVLISHFAFSAIQFLMLASCISMMTRILVINPVRELSIAAQATAIDGDWNLYSPSSRRRDEVGYLAERFSELSRRLKEYVRLERYESAHLVAVGVERSLDDPVRHAEIELAILQSLLPMGSEERRRCNKLAFHLSQIGDVGDRVKTIGSKPDPSKPS